MARPLPLSMLPLSSNRNSCGVPVPNPNSGGGLNGELGGAETDEQGGGGVRGEDGTTITFRSPRLFFAGGSSSSALGPLFFNRPNKPFIFALTLPALGFALGFAGSGGSSGPRSVGRGSMAGPSAQGFSSILGMPFIISGDVIYIEIKERDRVKKSVVESERRL
jgi:hypothetical protein